MSKYGGTRATKYVSGDRAQTPVMYGCPLHAFLSPLPRNVYRIIYSKGSIKRFNC